MVNRRSSCTASRTIPRPRGSSLPSSAVADVTSSHPGFAVTRRPRPQGRSTWQPSPSDVLALIDRWSPGRAVELVSHDWGGASTYDVCVTALERIERAVTLAFPPTHVHEPSAPRSATPELVHGALSTAGKRLASLRPQSRPHRPPLAPVVARPLARSGSPGGATRAPAGEHARRP
jgi:pimeloyl-ACP methyl ester carboxylesterase